MKESVTSDVNIDQALQSTTGVTELGPSQDKSVSMLINNMMLHMYFLYLKIV